MPSADGQALNDPMIRAVLNEILGRLRELHDTGQTARIDLRRLPLPLDGLDALIVELGRGEIEATMHGVGTCEFLETKTAGVWWVTQKNVTGETVGQFIEIALVPELLKCASEDVAVSLAQFEQRLSATS